MNLVESKIGEYCLLIETEDGKVICSNSGDRNTVKTGIIKDKIGADLINEAKGIIKHIASEFGNELAKVTPRPNDVEIEFEISLSTEASAWILTANGSSNLKVRIKWEKSN